MISTRNKGLDFPLEMKGSLSYIKLDKSKESISNGMCVKHLIKLNSVPNLVGGFQLNSGEKMEKQIKQNSADFLIILCTAFGIFAPTTIWLRVVVGGLGLWILLRNVLKWI